VAAVRGAMDAMRIALSFERQMQIQGLQSEAFALALLPTILTETATCMVTLCPQSGDPRAATYFASLAHQLALLGAAGSAFIDALLENMERCGAYEVSIDSRIDTSGPDANYSMRVAGKAKVTPSATLLEGQAPRARGTLEYTATSGSAPSFCEVTTISKTTNGEFELDDVRFSSFDPEKPANDPVLSLKINITVQPTETYHSTATGGENCGTSLPPDRDVPQWFFGFQSEHPGFTFPGTDFLRDAAPVFAIAVYSPRTITLGNGSISENTKVEIIHTPLPPVPLPSPG
jgi:hypothetical protein